MKWFTIAIWTAWIEALFYFALFAGACFFLVWTLLADRPFRKRRQNF